MDAGRWAKIISGTISVAAGGAGAHFFYLALQDVHAQEPAILTLDIIFTALSSVLLSTFIHFTFLADALNSLFSFLISIRNRGRPASNK
ncbi:MAG: hypothetical protein KJ720_12175 [Proteobacteria bacterium]|nr:hypothetical protein [Pseudomonadota bacterium]MBU1450715.1 hypothetical protein [Pseudomonadota bacterium]MBU2468654.1 hypothetical protein [Pseudomonadota bacterium]MBU2516093.1 hypothetical protein [Pseudomonadota bacterium]